MGKPPRFFAAFHNFLAVPVLLRFQIRQALFKTFARQYPYYDGHWGAKYGLFLTGLFRCGSPGLSLFLAFPKVS